jgi:HKD family nuclease
MPSAVLIELLSHARPIGERLGRDLDRGGRLSVAVAYAKESALAALDLERWSQRDGCELAVVAGTDFALTELAVLKRLEPRLGNRCRVFHGIAGVNFHPKLYLVEQGDRRIAYVGSSNLTLGGLRTNIEANVRLEGPADARELRDAAELFRELSESEFSTPVTPEFETRYTELQQQYRATQTRYPELHALQQLRVAEGLLVGQYRATAANRRQLLVVTPENFRALHAARDVGAPARGRNPSLQGRRRLLLSRHWRPRHRRDGHVHRHAVLRQGCPAHLLLFPTALPPSSM